MSEFSLDDPSFYEDFLVEAQEHFEQIEQNFLALEENPGNLEILNGIFRSVHTIKGASAFLGLTKVQSLAHIGENILDELRKGRMTVTPDVMELLFETADTLKVLVKDVGVSLHKEGEPANPDTAGLIARLEAIRGGGTAAPAAPAPSSKPVPGSASEAPSVVLLPPELPELEPEAREAAIAALSEGIQVLAMHVELLPEIMGTPFNPFSMISMVDLAGKLLHSSKILKSPLELDAFSPEAFPFDLVLLVQPTESMEAIQKLFASVRNVRIHYYPLSLGRGESVLQPSAPSSDAAPVVPAAPKPDVQAKPPVASKSGSDTIRVSQAKLDSFMNTVAELIISKTMINHVVERLEAEVSQGTVAELVKDLRKASVYLDQVSKEVQASVLGIRMVPVKSIFTKFPRMLRDLAKASGKKIDLQVFGEDTEIDKSLIEELGDPLIHLIRNSADHGVELPMVRVAAGKPETGTVTLRARHEGDSVVVEIEDDGKGIDPDVIRAKAVEKGLISQEKSALISDEEAINFIFLPGFSTAQKVTEISGRGVGMDVVRSNVRRLNGSVSVTSEVGRGSVFTLKLPLTLAIIDALLMRANGQVFALPGTSVEETLLVAQAELAHLTRRKAINLRGEVLGVTRLRDLLGLRHGADAALSPEGEDLPVVVVTAGGRRMGIIVDAFLRRQEMVIKPLAPYLASLPGISGASVMGDGGVVLILDPAELMTLAVEESL